MPAIPSETLRLLAKRDDNDNWANQEPGVVLVFAIVFVVGCGLIGLFAYRWIKTWRKNKSEVYTVD